jgi:hypothetical protein
MSGSEHTRSRAEVSAYLESQLPGRRVRHLERVGVEHVAGNRHEVWDAHVDDQRWWVVTNPTNLYPQEDFKSRDVVLTFHVGLAVRVMTRESVPVLPEAREIFASVWRRWEQAADALANAEEAEHFQAVGTHLRECLISFAHEIEEEGLVSDVATRPKASDVVAWAALFAEAIAPGGSNSRLRRYLKALIEPTWDYQQQLLHNKNATRLDGEFGLQSVAHLISCFTAAMLMRERKNSRCGKCDAYAMAGGVCRHCGWEDPDYDPGEPRARSEEEIMAALAEPCTPTSDIATLMTVDDME